MTESFPKSIGELSTNWLNQALSPGENEAIRAFRHELLQEQGATSLAFVLHLEFAHEEHEIPSKLLCKMSPESTAIREALRAGGSFEREVAFYRELGSECSRFVPRCYSVGFDDSDNTFLLLLEFIDHSSVRDVLVGTVDEVREAVTELAGFHADWWGKAEALPFIVREDCGDFYEQRLKQYAIALDNIKTNYSNQVGETVIPLLELYLPNAKILATEGREGPLTLCHGDYHRKQLLFPENEKGRFAVLDWQTVTIDRPAYDLARIIVVGLTNEQRCEHEAALVELYHRALVKAGINNYTLEKLWQHYKLGIVRIVLLHSWCLCGAINLQQLVDEWSAKGADWFEVFLKWPDQAMIDHNVLDYLSNLIARLKHGEKGVGEVEVSAAS